ncbi:glycosyltransferase family 2 protein [Microbacterium lushaniae]|uniref:Glycosyltransferase n=1 Tax=Microbacterium lushaniae TaxID=2614639 RepID=A0A5J6L0Z5_9MICO|nr:glycosyltransferase [Microbacterium lushaniae]
MIADLTVVIPAYNAESTIREAISSAQLAGAARVIVVDDGSTDATANLAAACGAEVHTQENSGAYVARATGSSLLESGYVIFLDADDLLIPEGVKNSVLALDEAPAVAVAAGVVVGFSRSSTRKTKFPIRYSPVNTHSLLTEGYGPWPPCNAVVRVSALRKAEQAAPEPLRPRYGDDYELLLRLSREGYISVRDEATSLYCMDGGKSVKSAESAIRSKELIRAHYSNAYGIAIRPMTEREILQSTQARIARAALSASRPVALIGAAWRWIWSDPRAAAARVGKHFRGLRSRSER